MIVPCYRYGHYLRQCVESVLSQSHGELRVLIIDDASPDHTEEEALRLTNQDPRVEYRRHQVNQRHIATYNEGLDWATGAYTLLLSADDLLAPDALARAVSFLDRYSDVGFVYGTQICFRDQLQPPTDRQTAHGRMADHSRSGVHRKLLHDGQQSSDHADSRGSDSGVEGDWRVPS